MSRIRSVHPGLWTDDGFVSLSLAARLFLIGIWNEADDYGLFEWKPLRLKMRLAPADNIDAPALMGELAEHGFLVRLSRFGKEYGAVKNFRKFQRPQKPGKPLVPVDNEIRDIICLSRDDSDPANVDIIPEPLPEHSGSPTVNPPQMEDGKVEGNGTLKASLSEKDARAPFDRFWEAWPHKVNRQSTATAFAKHAADIEPIIAGIARYVASRAPDQQWPDPAKWLDGRRWEDQPAPRQTAGPLSHSGVATLDAKRSVPGKVYVMRDTPRGAAWENAAKQRGKTQAWDREGGWLFPSEWPPTHERHGTA